MSRRLPFLKISCLLVAIILVWIVNPSPCLTAEMPFSEERFLGKEDVPWVITAKSLTYDEKKGICTARGDVEIKKQDQALYAQYAFYNIEEETVEVRGDVRLESGEDVLTGEKGRFNLRDKTGTIEGGSLFLKENHFYINAVKMKKVGEKSYVMEDFELTTCDGERPAWTITGSRVSVTIEGYGRVRDAAFRIKDIPSFYLPYLIFPAKTKRQSGLLPPRFGISSRNGFELELPFFWAISEQTDATFYQHYMSERGYMQGLEFRYLADEESQGTLLFDIMHDKKDKDMNDADDLDVSPFRRTNDTRYWFRGKADQDLPLELQARLDADFVSDQDYLREFEHGLFGLKARPDLVDEFGRPVEEKRSPLRRSALRVSYNRDDYSVQALGSYHQRPENPRNDRTPQPVGGIDFGLLPTPIFDLPAFFVFHSDYDYIYREAGDEGHRATLSPELRYPMWIGPYLEFEPHASYTYNMHWVRSDGHHTGHQGRHVYELGGRLSTNIERVFEVDWRKAQRLKHKISPVLSYTFRSHRDERDYRPWFETVDEEGSANRLAFALENYLDARLVDSDGKVYYRQWARLIIEQGFDIEEERHGGENHGDEEPFEPLILELAISPYDDIDFQAETRWDHYDNRFVYADVSLELARQRAGDREDTLVLDYEYWDNENNSLSGSAEVNLIHGFYVGGSLERDFDPSHNISSSCWIGYNRQCWGVKLVGERENGENSLMVVFNLLGLGELEF